MKHPAELDLHDIDKMEIDELEQQNIVLSVDLANAEEKIAELEFALQECQERGDGR